MKDKDSLVACMLCKRSLALIFSVPGSLIINRPCGAAMATLCSRWVTAPIDRLCTLFMESSRFYCPRSAEISHQPLLQDSRRSARSGPFLPPAVSPFPALNHIHWQTDWSVDESRERERERHDGCYWHFFLSFACSNSVCRLNIKTEILVMNDIKSWDFVFQIFWYQSILFISLCMLVASIYLFI